MQVEVVVVNRGLVDLEVVTRMNSIWNGPTCTTSRGLTVRSRVPASMPCSSSFGSTRARVIAVPNTGPSKSGRT
jgi:hypothetical protein